MTALFDVTVDDVATTNDDYYTPRWIFEAAGLTFDLDVSAPVDPSRRTCPARHYLTAIDDGLDQPWDGLVWMNPPYSNPGPWVDRFAAHQNGLALVPSLKRAKWLGCLLGAADAVTILSVVFLTATGKNYESSFALILAGCGPVAAEAVGRVAAADKYIGGAYHVRPGIGHVNL